MSESRRSRWPVPLMRTTGGRSLRSAGLATRLLGCVGARLRSPWLLYSAAVQHGHVAIRLWWHQPLMSPGVRPATTNVPRPSGGGADAE